ncbi:phage tail protein, partial [Escherichia coli]
GDLPGFVELLGSGFAVEYLSRKNPFGDIKSDGTVKTALENLGLGEGAPAIGVPFFWPSAAMPNTVIDSWSGMVFLKFNGAKFSATDYPVLAKVFPSLVLPEARGDFIRIWDDGRGVDGGRTLLSAQDFAQQRITGNFMGGAMGSSGSIKAGALVNSYTNYGATSQDLQHFSIDSAIETKTASETRPRNIAFNFLVRAK